MHNEVSEGGGKHFQKVFVRVFSSLEMFIDVRLVQFYSGSGELLPRLNLRVSRENRGEGKKRRGGGRKRAKVLKCSKFTFCFSLEAPEA